MKKTFKNMKENEKGFTLIELIVVIAIIGILAAVLLPKFSGFTDKAREKAVLSEAKSVYTAYASVQAEEGTVTDDKIKGYLGKAPKSDATGKTDVTFILAKVDPVITYTPMVNGKSYTVTIKDGGDITVK